ncbi:hypothetical protein N481_03490 [Pseudoalteromonas luteoviolacea S4047-1]|uniref:Uncharacterized protein n=1 Tax=Pseudoalteromonas luteoviolacea S4054 TaxID=1129367 RepID=A0A0F6A6K4_9GAMM|nr:hypothetical protein N479_03445 [Pseudoalteromonas luteoviolacea S4054]KZN62518.1 hypothetical protein N481_03490 [Pseudoalteromonas luteoviolacea S4047-1]
MKSGLKVAKLQKISANRIDLIVLELIFKKGIVESS